MQQQEDSIDQLDRSLNDNVSLIGDLGRRRDEIIKAQVLDIRVPRWTDPVIVVKCRPVEHPQIRGLLMRVEKAKPKDRAEAEVDANADLLIRGCIAIVAILDDGKEYSLRPGDPHGEPTLFDEDLAHNFGLHDRLGRKPTARDVVRALFITDADIITAANSLAEFSGYKTQDADDELVGEY